VVIYQVECYGKNSGSSKRGQSELFCQRVCLDYQEPTVCDLRWNRTATRVVACGVWVAHCKHGAGTLVRLSKNVHFLIFFLQTVQAATLNINQMLSTGLVQSQSSLL